MSSNSHRWIIFVSAVTQCNYICNYPTYLIYSSFYELSTGYLSSRKTESYNLYQQATQYDEYVKQNSSSSLENSLSFIVNIQNAIESSFKSLRKQSKKKQRVKSLQYNAAQSQP